MDQNTAILVEFLYWTNTPSQIAKMTVIGEEGVSVVRTSGTGFYRMVYLLSPFIIHHHFKAV
jgi:hypothetical protein